MWFDSCRLVCTILQKIFLSTNVDARRPFFGVSCNQFREWITSCVVWLLPCHCSRWTPPEDTKNGEPSWIIGLKLHYEWDSGLKV